jgi:hypothetical protein
VHDGLIARLRTELNHQLGPAFVADAGTSVYVMAADEQRSVFRDIYVIETQREEQAGRGARLPAPVQVLLNVPETVSQPHIFTSLFATGRAGASRRSLRCCRRYSQPPPPPALSRDDAKWVAEQVERWPATRARHREGQ